MEIRQVGRYQIQRRLGTGGMGALYLARDPSLDRFVAIRLLKEDFQDDPEVRERFIREARSVTRLRHPNIVIVYDVGEDDGRPFMAMEYIPGDTLTQVLRRTPSLPLVRRLELMEDLCAGLAHAHAMGIVHRDIKPADIMLDGEGVLKILDFGIATIGNSGTTREGKLTLNYMSPEQVAGRGVDHRTDIFATGAVLYEAIALEQAFPGSIDTGILHKILNEGPVPLEQRVPGIDPELAAIARKALDQDVARRYQDANVLRQDLGRVRRRLVENEHSVPASIGRDTTLVEPPSPRRLPPERLAELRRQQVEEHLRFGEEAFARGEHDAALHHAERAATVDPDSREAIDLIDRARLAIEAAVRQREQHIATTLDRARQSLDQGAYDTALRAVYDVLALDPESPTARALEQQAKDLLQAQREDERARRGAYERLAHAESLAREGRYAAALAEVDAIGLDDPRIATLRRQITDLVAEAENKTRQEARDRVAAKRVEAAQRLLAGGDGYAAIALLERDGSGHPLVDRALRDIRIAVAELEERVRKEGERRRQEEEASRRAEAAEAEERRREEARPEQEMPTRAEFERYRGGAIVPPLDVSTARRVDDNVRFTVYRPAVMAPQRWYPLLFFTHVGERRPDAPPDQPDPLAQVETIARSLLGSAVSSFPRIVQDAGAGIPHEALLRIVPSVPGLTFNPPEYPFLWTDSVHKAEFRIRASASLEGQTARGSIDVRMGLISVALITVAIAIDARPDEEKPPVPEVFQPYRRIFASYSHKDSAIVRQFENYARGVGDSYMRDVIDLRAGEIWSDRLMSLIDGADVFQLFWSTNSMESPFVRCEWEHALTVNKSQFVRPLYWETPFPEREGLPPPELKAFHFASVAIGEKGTPRHTLWVAAILTLFAVAAAVFYVRC